MQRSLTSSQVKIICSRFGINLVNFTSLEKTGVNSNFLYLINGKYVLKPIFKTNIDSLIKFNIFKSRNSFLYAYVPKVFFSKCNNSFLVGCRDYNFELQEFVKGGSIDLKHKDSTKNITLLASCLYKIHDEFKFSEIVQKSLNNEVSYEDMFSQKRLKELNKACKVIIKKEPNLKDKLLAYKEKALKVNSSINKNILNIDKSQLVNTLIHRDINKGNVLFKKDSYKIIDWENAAYGFYLQDIAYIFSHFLTNKNHQSIFLKSYPLNPSQLNIVYILVEGLRFRSSRWAFGRYMYFLQNDKESLKDFRRIFVKSVDEFLIQPT